MAQQSTGARPLRWGRFGWLDLALAGVLVLAAVLSTVLDPEAAHPYAEIIAFMVAGSVALRTAAPLGMAVIAAAGVLVLAFLPDPSTPLWAFVTSLVVAFSLTAHLSGPRALVGLGVLLTAEYVIQARTSTDLLEVVFTPPILVFAPALAGWLLARSRAQARRLAELTAELERSRARVAELSAEAERARLTRELHDVLGHTLSSIAVQAGAAGELLPQDAPAAGPVRQIRRAARDGLDEVRVLLAAQRRAAATGPGIDAVATLAEADGAALTILGAPRPLPEGVSRAGYRIVQEALTNARRHAPGAAVRITLRYEAEWFAVEVTNDGPFATATGAGGYSGRGLLGIRERALGLGGHAEAGPDDHGGWQVRVELPSIVREAS